MPAMTGRDFVLDASVAVARLLEQDREAGKALDLLKGESKGIVPDLWHLETRNSLLVGMRRRKLTAGRLRELLAVVGQLPVVTDYRVNLETAFDLAVRHSLTVYDAVYLEVARRRDVPIATFDKAIAKAAQAEKLPLIYRKVPCGFKCDETQIPEKRR